MATYNDPAKQRSREKLEAFVRTHVLSNRSAKDVTVLCFPGAERQGQEAIEVKEVYDELGIPRKNITGIEYDPQRAKRLRAARLGINVVEGTDLDHLQETSNTYTVISLDYTGQQTRDALETLRTIADRKILQSRGVLCTNYSTGREAESMQLRYAWRKLNNLHAQGKLNFEAFREGIRDLSEGKFPEDVSLDEMRDAITLDTINILFSGKFSQFSCGPDDPEHLPRSWTTLPDYPALIDAILESRTFDTDEHVAKMAREVIRKARILSRREEASWNAGYELRPGRFSAVFTAALANRVEQSAAFRELVRDFMLPNATRVYQLWSRMPLPQLVTTAKDLIAKSDSKNIKPFELALELKAMARNSAAQIAFEKSLNTGGALPQSRMVAEMISLQDTGGMYARAMERYSYTSLRRTPMFMDIGFYDVPDELFAELERVVQYNRNSATTSTAPLSSKRLHAALQTMDTQWQHVIGTTLRPPSRIYLGSAIVDEKQKELLTFDELLMLRHDATLFELAEVYRLPKLTVERDIALQLTNAGVTAGELKEFYNVPIARTSAWKAHVTMGTYQEKSA